MFFVGVGSGLPVCKFPALPVCKFAVGAGSCVYACGGTWVW